MTQIGEGSANQKIYIEKPEEKDEISIRISLFYDGTLNNRINIDEREAAKLNQVGPSGESGSLGSYYKYRKDDGSSSYDNGRTNIAIMEPHLRKQAEGYDIAVKEYIEGQGTFNLSGDSFIGYAMGGGDSGVASRAEQGIDRGLTLAVKDINTSKLCIKKLTVDVFGFSRGAATARYAIHLALHGSTKQYDEMGDQYIQAVLPIIELVANRGIEIYENAVEICFAGLYDTVLSYYASQILKFKWVGNRLQQKAVKHAKKVLHLAAADEHRADFPLHNIKSAGSKGEEYYLPGVHSDVGGSYNKASDRAIETETDPGKKVYMETTHENKVILASTKRDIVEEDRTNLINQGWYLDKQIQVKPVQSMRRRGLNTAYHTVGYELNVERDNICSAYCNIPLKLMAKYARDKDVKLKFNNKLDRRAKLVLATSPDLEELEIKIRQYIEKVKGNGVSKAEDWLSQKTDWGSYITKHKIRNKHFNFSSHPKLGYSPRIKKDQQTNRLKRIRYIYNA